MCGNRRVSERAGLHSRWCVDGQVDGLGLALLALVAACLARLRPARERKQGALSTSVAAPGERAAVVLTPGE